MPKYNHPKLESYLKIDSKKIKSKTPSLKNANILNYLSTLLGYKNYQEIKNRKNDTKLINLTDLTLSEIGNIRDIYSNSICKEYNITYFFSSLYNILPIEKIFIDNNAPSKKIDLSEYNSVLKLDNNNFENFIMYSIFILLKDDISLEHKVSGLLNMILKIMKDLKVKDFQSEIINYIAFDDIENKVNLIKNKELLKEVKEYLRGLKEGKSDHYEQHGYFCQFIGEAVFNPYIDISSSLKKNYKKVINVSDFMSGNPSVEIIFHNKNYNNKILMNLFKIQFNYLISKDLPLEYKESLKGFKEQSRLAKSNLKGKKVNLSNSHELLSKNKSVTKNVFNILKTHGVDNLDENKLFEVLLSENKLALTHLNKYPTYYLAFKAVGDIEYYFITTYFNDCQKCGGSSTDLEDVIEMQGSSLPNEVDLMQNCPDLLKETLIEPEMASHFYTKQ